MKRKILSWSGIFWVVLLYLTHHFSLSTHPLYLSMKYDVINIQFCSTHIPNLWTFERVCDFFSFSYLFVNSLFLSLSFTQHHTTVSKIFIICCICFSGEHLWPRSYGLKNGPSLTDIHNIRPADVNGKMSLPLYVSGKKISQKPSLNLNFQWNSKILWTFLQSIPTGGINTMENAVLNWLNVWGQQIKKLLWTQKLTRIDGHHLNRFFSFLSCWI